MNIVDYVILGVLGLSVLMGFYRGFISSVLNTGGCLLAFGLSFVLYPRAAEWVRGQGWEPVRFFCVMGRMAAALVIVEEGNDMSGTRPRDMPGVTEDELALARRHLGSMLKAGGDAPPIKH